MRRLIALAAATLALAAAAPATAHPHRYWWVATDTCSFAGWSTPVSASCAASSRDGWRNRPQGPIDGIDPNSPQAIRFNQNYCPYGRDGRCPHPN